MSGRKKVTDNRGNLIKGKAVVRGYTIPELAKKVGIPESTLYRKLKFPGGVNLSELELIDEAVGFTDDELLYFVRWRRCEL